MHSVLASFRHTHAHRLAQQNLVSLAMLPVWIQISAIIVRFAWRREKHGVMNSALYKSTPASTHLREYQLPVFTRSLIIYAFRLQMWL